MNLVPPGPAALAGIVLFLVPGLLFLALLRRQDQEALPLDEALFLVVASSLALSSWLALLLAELGCFSLPTAAIVLGVLGLFTALVFRKRLAWPFRGPGSWRQLAPALLVLALAFGLDARPTEYLLGGRDPGTYVSAMALIGRTGGIVYTDPAVLSIPREDVELFYRNPAAPDFTWGRFMGFPLERPETGRVTPEFFHLFPAFGAYLFQAMGVKGALATPPLFGILGTLGVFLVFRRLLGPPAALLAALWLALNAVQVWFARYPVSEPMSQFLIFLGLLAFAHWEERGSAAFGLLAGVAFGLSLLVRIDSVLIALPLVLYLLVRRAHRDLPLGKAMALLLPFLLLLGHTAVHAAFFARKYLLNIANRPYWRQPAAVWLAVALLAVALVVVVHLFGPLLVRRLEAHGETLRTLVMAGVAGLALYAYFLRPWLSAWAGADGNDPSLGRLGFLRESGYRLLAAHDAQAFLRLGWFVTPLALWLGVLGLLLIIHRLRGRDLFPVLLVLTFSLFYLYKIRVWNDYFFALRRFVPVVLPFLLGFAALTLTRMSQGGRWRRRLAGG
ncbi:MAG TPA: glycosyltransferase family 39 protein, partial [Vicinamibacteria bacterium]|nr:glycosyltransferase family 39 protein [Vicinamibacteria bacterium]